MSEREMGAGELAGVRKRRRLQRVVIAIFLVSVGIGWVLGQNRFLFGPTGSISPTLAIGASIALAIVLGGGAWMYARETDELDLRDNLIAGNVGLCFYVLAFPIWLTLARAGLTDQPSQEIIYVSTLILTALAYYWKRWRP